jgi:hypothetical protein
MSTVPQIYRLLQQLIHQGGSVAGQMAKLLAEFEPSLPAKELNALRSLDYESELSALTARLQSGIDAAPPPKMPGGIYFGLFLPGREDGSIVADFYLATTDENDPADAECHWVSSLDYFPPDAQAQSQVLEHIYRLLPGLPEEVRTTAEDVLCLGYTGFVVAHILNAPGFRAWCEDGRVISVAVGWDSGDLLRIGELTAEGFRAPEPAKKPKRKAKGSGLDHISKLGGVVHFVPPPYESPPPQPLVELYPVEVNGAYGFINVRGEIAIEPKFSEAGRFQEGLAPVKTDSGWGFINAAGEVVIEPRFKGCGNFQCGLAAVDDGYIDLRGKRVIRWSHNNADWAPRFQCGRVILEVTDGLHKWVCLDERGEVVFSGDGVKPIKFSDGLVNLPFCKPGTVMMDRQGRKVMELPAYQRGKGFEIAGPFSEGLAALHMGKNGHGYMDRSGRIVFRLKRGEIGGNHEFREGRAAFWCAGKSGYVNREGEEVVAPRFKTAWEFSSGLACVTIREKIGFIALDGTLQIPYRFDYITDFHGPLAQVVEKGKIKYINQAGEIVWHGPAWSPR